MQQNVAALPMDRLCFRGLFRRGVYRKLRLKLHLLLISPQSVDPEIFAYQQQPVLKMIRFALIGKERFYKGVGYKIFRIFPVFAEGEGVGVCRVIIVLIQFLQNVRLHGFPSSHQRNE